MQHYQEILVCQVCALEIVLDVLSYGAPHQRVLAATHMACADPEKLLGLGKVDVRFGDILSCAFPSPKEINADPDVSPSEARK